MNDKCDTACVFTSNIFETSINKYQKSLLKVGLFNNHVYLIGISSNKTNYHNLNKN